MAYRGWLQGSPTLGKMAQQLGKGAKIGGWALYALNAFTSGINRYEEAQNDPNAFPPWLSSIMGGLAGGAGAPLGEWGYWGGAVNNISSLANAIITGFTTGGPAGAVAFAAANVAGQIGRLGEEIYGLYYDYGETNKSFGKLLELGTKTTDAFKSREKDRAQNQAGATTDLEDQIDILGPLQSARAKFKGSNLANYEWYFRKDNPFYDLEDKSGIELEDRSRNYARTLSEYWNGKVDGTTNSVWALLQNVQTFDPNLIPEKQKASFSSGNVFANKYSDEEITKAYEQVAEEQKKRQLAYLADKGLVVGEFWNGGDQEVFPLSHANLIANLQDQASAIFDRTRGTVGDDGNRDPDTIKFASAYQKDQQLLDIDDAMASIIDRSVGYFNTYPTDVTTRDREGFNTSTDYLRQVNEQAVLYNDRLEELKEITRKSNNKKEMQRQEGKKPRIDSNAEQAKNF